MVPQAVPNPAYVDPGLCPLELYACTIFRRRHLHAASISLHVCASVFDVQEQTSRVDLSAHK
jgi:hypothetical protein